MILNTRIINDIQYIIDNVYNNTVFLILYQTYHLKYKEKCMYDEINKKHVLNQNIILTVLRNV